MKRITIDVEAYKRLVQIRRNGESFSETIKRVIKKPVDFKRWLKSIEKDPLTEQAVDAVEKLVALRQNSLNRRRPSSD